MGDGVTLSCFCSETFLFVTTVGIFGSFCAALLDPRMEPLANDSKGIDEDDENDTEDEDDGRVGGGITFFWLRLFLFAVVLDTFCGAGIGSAIHSSNGTFASMGAGGDDPNEHESDEHDEPEEDEDERLIRGGKSDRDEEDDDADKVDNTTLRCGAVLILSS